MFKTIYLDSAANHSNILKFKQNLHIKNISNQFYDENIEELKLIKEKKRKMLDNFMGNFVYTSGASESNSMVLNDIFHKNNCSRIDVLSSSVEHGSIMEGLKFYKKYWNINFIKPNKNNDYILTFKDFQKHITKDTKLIILMACNNEVGNLNFYENFPDKNKRNYKIFADCTQLFGKSSINSILKKVDYVSFSFHKIGGFKTGGGLFYTDKIITPFIFGKHGIRGGTINNDVELYNYETFLQFNYNIQHMKDLRDYCIKKLKKYFDKDKLIINTNLKCSLPSILNFTIVDVCSLKVLEELNKYDENNKRYIIGIGSACNTKNISNVLLDYGVIKKNSFSTFRISFEENITKNDCKNFIKRFNEIIVNL